MELIANEDGLPIMRKTSEVPKINTDKIIHAVSVVHSDYFELKFWNSREELHITFSYPLLSVIKRV